MLEKDLDLQKMRSDVTSVSYFPAAQWYQLTVVVDNQVEMNDYKIYLDGEDLGQLQRVSIPETHSGSRALARILVAGGVMQPSSSKSCCLVPPTPSP